MSLKIASGLMVTSFLGACVLDDADPNTTSSSSQESQGELRPKMEHPVRDAARKHGGGGGNGISYHGGPVMLGSVNVHYIWYGNWSGNSATSILTNLAQGIGGSPYEAINGTYYDGTNTHV